MDLLKTSRQNEKLREQTYRLIGMFVLTSSYFLVEIIIGYITNSTALVADSFHMLSDVMALVIALLSIRMSPKKWSKNTFGWARAEVLGALVNAVFLIALCFSILVEALKRFFDPEETHNPVLILYVGGAGLLVNIIGLFLFHVSSSQMNMKGVFLHVLADALGSVIVIISALIIWLTSWEYRFYVDPVL
ncbi:zinc/cadmium resistance protein-like, partial [Limulus polyphemus]|uniref:Zinc/cadmium resistance protein-like n=1 Tax=Limulus polyphemus TaxID=6850 RepID=A0ABM1TAV7_LIMPO